MEYSLFMIKPCAYENKKYKCCELDETYASQTSNLKGLVYHDGYIDGASYYYTSGGYISHCDCNDCHGDCGCNDYCESCDSCDCDHYCDCEGCDSGCDDVGSEPSS